MAELWIKVIKRNNIVVTVDIEDWFQVETFNTDWTNFWIDSASKEMLLKEPPQTDDMKILAMADAISRKKQ